MIPYRVATHHPAQQTPYPGRVELHEFISYWKMDEVAVSMLNFLYELDQFDTVISSSWKKLCGKSEVEDLFATNGLILHLGNDWCTQNLSSTRYCTRASEIELYIKDHPSITDYLILDDKDSGSSLDAQFTEPYMSGGNRRPHTLNQERIFLVNPDTGIDSNTYRMMRNVFVVSSV